ncbi:MAG: hypothetical protein EBS24_08500, partial [Chitinophagia bacterium]|nr:hypothetical protein [Chitinophagia bacterium]
MTDTFILNLETSAKDCSIALGKNGECLGTRKSKGEWKHSREITLLIEQTIKDAFWSGRLLQADSPHKYFT